VLLSSHQIVEIDGVCDTFTVLSRGRVVWDGTAEQMRAEAPASAYRMATSDDLRALALAREEPDVQAELSLDGGLTVEAASETLDRYVLALGRSGVAVRRLELPVNPLESMFFALTDQSREHPAVVSAPAENGHAEH
jgi:ABC-2 type transport system ATP-binding protein